MFKKLLPFVLVVAFCGTQAMEKPEKLILAHEDKDAYPWVFPIEGGYAGMDLEILKILESKIGIKIETKAYPWARCLTSMESGDVNGAFASSYKEDREKQGAYPKKDGKLDASRYIHISGYSLYYTEKAPITFDGEKFTGVSKPLGAQRDFSIVPLLKKLNIAVDEGSIDPVAILKKLDAERISAAALQTARADNIIATVPELKHIKKLDSDKAPFDQKPYFLMLSHQFVAKYPAFAEFIWDQLKDVVSSEELDKKEAEFFTKY